MMLFERLVDDDGVVLVGVAFVVVVAVNDVVHVDIG